jgi:dienelactone hydrolase
MVVRPPTFSGNTGSRQPFTAFAVWMLAGFLMAVAASPGLADDLVFRRHVINADSEFMAAAVFDVNKDGILDIVCGGYWYEGPTWKKHFLRGVEVFGGRPDGYAHQVLDVNGDGWSDLITINWRSASLKWIEHPGPELFKEKEWKAHTIATPGASETGRLVDLLGDGTPVILPCGSNFAAWWELRRKPQPGGGTTPEWIRHDLPRELAGHGIGTGDINGDGRMDIVGRSGWAEAPKDPRTGKWIWHPDFDLDQATIPILVVDVDGDGLNDIVWSRGHDYGMYWLQQTRTADNQIKWIKHTIDTSVAGCHAPLWEDLDGDGRKELIMGRRYLAHEGRDPGEYDPQAIYRYQFDPKTRTWKRWLVSFNDGICFGLDPKAVDLRGDGKMGLVCGGRNGLYWLEHVGRGSSVASGETKDPLKFPTYDDHLKLMVVRDEARKETPVKGPFDWGQRRAHILAAVQHVLGELPDSYQRVPLEMRVVAESISDGVVRKKITYGSDLTGRASAMLLIPEKVKRGAPAMICLHDDVPPGKEDGDALSVADELARRGYVCIVPDYPTHGEGSYDFAKNPGQYASGAMKAVWDNLRALDLLETMPEVNAKRIGIIGHGLGGQNALFTAAFDYRIAAVVSSCGMTTFGHYRGGDLRDWSRPAMAPRIGTVFKSDPAQIPYDFGELLATLAPRAVFLSAPVGDKIAGVEGVKKAVEAAGAVYQLRKVGTALRAEYPETGREFSTAARAAAFAWLDQRFKR